MPNLFLYSAESAFQVPIYKVGNLENGIHALPILSSGKTLWAGLLGQPASFGCVILGTADAQTLYNWAEVGTPVIIQK